LGLGYDTIHVCPNNCVLFQKGLAKHDALLIIALHSYVPDVIVPFVGEVPEIQTES